MAQISLPHGKNSMILRRKISLLWFGKLYGKLLLSLEGSDLVVSQSHLWASGNLLLQELVQTCKPKNVPKVIAAKTSALWGFQMINDPLWNPLKHFSTISMVCWMNCRKLMNPFLIKAQWDFFFFSVLNSRCFRIYTPLKIFQPSGKLKIGQRYLYCATITSILYILRV